MIYKALHRPMQSALPQVHVDSGNRVMVFNSTFNNISVISWWLVLLVEEIGVPQKSTDMPQVTDNFIAHCCIDYRVHPTQTYAISAYQH
jgi:hypothetical protein